MRRSLQLTIAIVTIQCPHCGRLLGIEYVNDASSESYDEVRYGEESGIQKCLHLGKGNYHWDVTA